MSSFVILRPPVTILVTYLTNPNNLTNVVLILNCIDTMLDLLAVPHPNNRLYGMVKGCDQRCDRVFKNDKRCHICNIQLF